MTSHEQEIDFGYFYCELKNFLVKLSTEFFISINFNLTFLMQDACLASYNGLKQLYPECCVLMCWYHLKARVDIHIKVVENKDVRSYIIADINKLHFSWSNERYNHCYNEMLFKYVSFDHEGNMFDKEGNVGAANFSNILLNNGYLVASIIGKYLIHPLGFQQVNLLLSDTIRR